MGKNEFPRGVFQWKTKWNCQQKNLEHNIDLNKNFKDVETETNHDSHKHNNALK